MNRPTNRLGDPERMKIGSPPGKSTDWRPRYQRRSRSLHRIGSETVERSPYLIVKLPLCLELVVDFDGLYLLFSPQESVQEGPGTQRSEESARVTRSIR